MLNELSLDFLFHPKSVAIAGVSDDSVAVNTGRRYMQSLIESGFQGNIYPISPNGGQAFGSKIYQNAKDIPDRVDLVISAIPAHYTPQLVRDCAAKGVKAVHFFTSGFSEIEDAEGKKREAEILRVARQNGIRILGPNCMGLYCPSTGLSFSLDFPKQSGPLGFFSQSGGKSYYCVREASTRGIYLSKVISYGNASDINESDFLEYFTHDPETKIIGAYIEGVKDGSRFIRLLKRATKVKPVIIYKAGITETGTGVAASHTGAIAGSNRIWEGLLKQAGAIQVHGIDEIVDVALLFLRMSLPKGKNTAIIGVGGGASVQATDECTNAGLILPMLPTQTRRRLRDIYGSEAGHIFRNPVDLNMVTGPEIIQNVVKVVADCDRVDLLIMHVGFDALNLMDRADRRVIIERQVEGILSLNGIVNKPVAVVLHSYITDEDKQLISEAHVRMCEAGFPVYPSFRRAASAINRFIEYHQRHQKSQAASKT